MISQSCRRGMFNRQWIFLGGVILFLASSFIPLAIRAAALVVGVNQEDQYEIVYYTVLSMALGLATGGLLIIIAIFLKGRRAGK